MSKLSGWGAACQSSLGGVGHTVIEQSFQGGGIQLLSKAFRVVGHTVIEQIFLVVSKIGV